MQGGGRGGNIFDFFFGGGGFGQGQEEEERTPKGHDIYVDLFVSLKDLYVGREISTVRDKSVYKPASGTRKCKCKQKLVTRQLGPGMFQQYTQQVGVRHSTLRVLGFVWLFDPQMRQRCCQPSAVVGILPYLRIISVQQLAWCLLMVSWPYVMHEHGRCKRVTCWYVCLCL